MLSETDRTRLQTSVHSGQHGARARPRAQVLLKLGEGWSLAEVRRAFDGQFTSRQARVKLQELHPVVHAQPD